MKIPPGMTEAEVLAAIDRCANILAPSFVFGYLDVDDLRQEARILGMECLDRYDPARPLPNFLYAHMKKRLSNFKRNKFFRNDPPCRLCHDGRHREHDGGRQCGPYLEWLRRNSLKANLTKPVRLDTVPDEREPRMRCESSVETDAQVAELQRRIDVGLPARLRSAYLRMRAGEAVARPLRDEVEHHIKELIRDGLWQNNA
jgi:hypothetical protein